MSLYQKYRVRELGKDFNMKPQQVMDLLEARFGEAPANQQAVLSAAQLNYLFDYLIEKNQIPSLATYFQAYQGKEPYAVRQRRLKQEKQEKEELAKKKEDVNSLEFIEQTAREKLDMFYPNEKVYIDKGM